jgi:multimeric flavodoxin WrbA
MKVIALNGSPRAGGNTEILLKKAMEPLAEAGWETEYIRFGGKPVRGCMACGKCSELKNRRCAITTDKLNDYMDRIFEADAILIGSPTYFADMTAETKALLDRVGVVNRANGFLLNGKIGAAVVAVRRGGATHVFDSINHMFQMSNMILPGSSYWNMGYGLAKEDVLEDAEGLLNMKQLGSTIAWLGKAMKAQGEAYPMVTA